METLKDPVVKVRRNAAEALGFFTKEAEKTVGPLKACLADTDRSVRIAAILSLGRIGTGMEEVGDTLHKLSNDPDEQIQLNVRVALAELGMGHDSDILVLFEALSNSYQETANSAARALGIMGNSNPGKVFPGLVQVLESQNPRVWSYALRVLRQMKQKAEPALPNIVALYEKADNKTKMDILETVTIIDARGDYALPVLQKALVDSGSENRKEALIRLMRFKSHSNMLLGPLAQILKDPDPENRLLALSVIRSFGQKGSSALPDLIELTSDSDIRVKNAALNAIVIYQPMSDQVLAALVKAVRDQDARVRTAAINAMRNGGAQNPEKVIPVLRQALAAEKNAPTKRLIDSVLESLEKTPGKSETSH